MGKQQDTIDNNPTIEVKKDWRRDNLATRIDLRMPNEVYDRVIEIAIASGEKINPKTSQVRVTATLNKLIEIGIRYYPEDNPMTSVNVGQLSDVIGLEEKYQQLSDRYRELESIVSDINPIVSELSQDIIRLKSIEIEEVVKTFVGIALKPIEERVNELATDVQNHFNAMRGDVKTLTVEVASPLGTIAEEKEKMNWREFHIMIDMEPPGSKNRTIATANIALDRAKELGHDGWKFDSSTKGFLKTREFV